MYLKVSSKGDKATTEIAAADIADQTQGLEEHVPGTGTLGASKLDASHIHMQAALAKFEDADPSDKKKKGPVMVEKSWRVNPDEFIIKVDASPLHQSAARRMFSPKAKAEAAKALEATTEEAEEEPSEEHLVDWQDFWKKLNTYYFSGEKK
jgi:hypothetical protein